MTFTIHKEAPKVKLVTMGQADKEINMAKGVSFETHPDLYHLRPGTTEPELKPGIDSTAGADVVSKEPADKAGPVGARAEPRKAEETKVSKKK